jgi:YesN/AraC family two-component response regulator
MVSALSDTENLCLAVKSGTSGFISKPFTRATIYEKLINIFGKEKIDQLSRNEFMGNLYENTASFIASDKSQQKESFTADPKAAPSASAGQEPQPQQPPKPVVSHDQLAQHYQDSEKRSIESIKKLLQKSRK